MALDISEVRSLCERIRTALASDRLSGFDKQFLEGHSARLDQHGTHAMMTADQKSRIEAILARAGDRDDEQNGEPS